MATHEDLNHHSSFIIHLSMNIGIDIRTLTDSQYSGVPEYTLNLVKELIRLDKNNNYKLYYNSFRDLSASLPEFKGENVEIVRGAYPNKLLNYFLFKQLNFPKIDQKLGVDLFLMPHLNFIALSQGCKKMLTVHDLSFLRQPDFFSFRKNFWHKMIKVKKLVNQFDKIIAVSQSTKNDLIDLCQVPEDKVKVIYSGIDENYRIIDKSDPEYKFIKRKYNLPERFIFYLGTREPRKNIEGIIKAYERLRESEDNYNEYKLIIGGGKGWKDNKIFQSWRKSKYKNDINFLGYVDKKDKVYLYNLAALFIYPSFYEGFGFPPLEAMACGTPVIISHSSSLPEVSGECSLMVDPYNIKEVTQAIKELLTNKELTEEMIKKGLEKVKKFSWKECANEYLELFKSL